MTSTSGSGRDPARDGATRNGARARHDEAVIQAEVRRLAQALRPFGVLSRRALEHAAGAEHWQEGGFDRALSAAVRAGAIEPEPLGFYRIAGEPAGRRAEG